MVMMNQKQIQAINDNCKNNWKFNTLYFMSHQVKSLVKIVSIDDENYLEFILNYNNNKQIILHISKFYTQKHIGTAISEEQEKVIVLDKTSYSKKNIHNLILKTFTLTDDELLKLNKIIIANTGV